MIGRLKDTIAAISTPLGEGAISVIRVSGDMARKCVASRFRGKLDLTKVKSHTAHFGHLIDANGNHLDDVVCTVFLAPTSYTGEDVIEVSCHGGIHVTRRVFESLLETGVRPAEPGEFTQRAFLNGKMDLSQSEAIADLIKAQSDKAYKLSLSQLEGTLSEEIRQIRDRLLKSAGLLELELDFIEDDIELVDKKKFTDSIESALRTIEKLLSTYKYGKVWKEGVRTALVGAPNAGKSSILNALLREERAIVTNIPGTTRDFIEENISISGVIFKIVDTAGLRKTYDSIEQEGVKKTWKVVQTADIVVLTHDSTTQMNSDELDFLEYLQKNLPNTLLIIANNKADLYDTKPIYGIDTSYFKIISTSTLNHEGIEPLKIELSKFVINQSKADSAESITIANERHYSALLRARDGLISSLESLKLKKSGEFIAVDIRQAIDAIGEIIGSVTTEDILNDIFSKFCIGK